MQYIDHWHGHRTNTYLQFVNLYIEGIISIVAYIHVWSNMGCCINILQCCIYIYGVICKMPTGNGSWPRCPVPIARRHNSAKHHLFAIPPLCTDLYRYIFIYFFAFVNLHFLPVGCWHNSAKHQRLKIYFVCHNNFVQIHMDIFAHFFGIFVTGKKKKFQKVNRSFQCLCLFVCMFD